MPLEIRELVIKASVGDKKSGMSSNTNSEGKDNELNINEIVEKVLEIIKDKNER